MNRLLPRRTAIGVFLAFAFAYFLSALLRAITATLSPVLTQEFHLGARDLGLLGGGYFLGFAAMQLPLGTWLDHHGPKKVILPLLGVAVLGSLAFSAAGGFVGLLAARVLVGVGVSACLMAPLAGNRGWLSPAAQLRANSWMLMTGSLGMVASTLPVQWLLPQLGWRPMFWGLSLLMVVAAGLIVWAVPSTARADGGAATVGGYSQVWRHPYFLRMAPIGFFSYGGLIAIQTLWAAPWMSHVMGYSPIQAATGLFWINLCMLGTFWTWGVVNPRLARAGLSAERLIMLGLPLSFVLLAIIVIAGEGLSALGVMAFCLYCMSCSFVALAQPAVGMAFSSGLAGRALTAYNLVIFAGVFAVQWGIGLLVDGFRTTGLAEVTAYRLAMGVFLLCCVAAHGWFLWSKPHNQQP